MEEAYKLMYGGKYETDRKHTDKRAAERNSGIRGENESMLGRC
jgi:hypothetical protein